MNAIDALGGRIDLEWRLALRRIRGLSRQNMNSHGFRWGLVGPGGMGEEFARAIAREDAGRLEAVYSRSMVRAKRFARRHAVTAAYDDLREMLRVQRGMLDLIYIATPAETHYELVRMCLGAGFSVLCEKPLVPTLNEAQNLFDLADSNDIHLFEGMWMRCLPTHTQAHSWLSAGEIGTIESVHAAILKAAPGPEKRTLMDFGAYAVSFASDLMTPGPLTLTVSRNDDEDGADRDWEIDSSDAAGARFTLLLSNRREGPSGARIDGTRGSIEFASQFNRTNRVSLLDADGRVRAEKTYDYSSSGLEHQIRSVMTSLDGGPPSPLTRSRSLRAAKLLETIAGASAGRNELRIEL